MAEIIKYVSLSNLTKYDEKIKAHIASADETLRENLEGQVEVVAGALDSEITRAKAAEATNAAAAEAAQKTADDITTYVGTFTASEGVDTVVKYIDAKTANIASDETVNALAERMGQAESDIDALEGRATDLETAVADRYTKSEIDTKVNTLNEADTTLQGNIDTLSQTVSANKSAIEGTVSTLEQKVDANETDIEGKMTALTARVAANETAVGTTLPNAIADEKARAEEAEAGLQTQINTIMNNPDTEGVINSINEFTQYISEHGEVAEGFRTDIDKNKEDIAGLDGRLDTVEGKTSTLEGEMDAVQSDIEALQAAIADGGSVEQRIADLETASATHALKTDVEAVETALTEYEDAHKDDYTNSEIDAKIKVNTDAIAALDSTYATDAELAQAIEDEVSRSNEAYAAKSLEQTVADHKVDTVSHVTADERTLWNTVSDKATSAALSEEVSRATAKEAELQEAIDAFEECTTAEIEALFQ